MTANEEFFDAQIRHQVYVQRLAGGDVKRTLEILQRSDRELVAKLRKRLNPGDFTSKRYKALLKDVRALRREVMVELAGATRKNLKSQAKAEQLFMKKLLEDTVPVRLDYAVADATRLAALVTEHPFAAGTNAARPLAAWWSNLAAADANRIVDSIQLGMVQGETIDQMVGRVVTATDMTRNNAEAVVRTGVNHASNSARGEFFKENKSVLGSLMWSAMLDGRTTLICASRDGHHAPADGEDWTNVPLPHLDSPLDRPPAHVRCRSGMVGVLNADGVAQTMPQRPFVRDARTRRWREKDFRADAKASVGTKKWSSMDRKQRSAAITKERQAWARERVGTVPGKTTYEDWLRRQPKGFQEEVLGKGKAKLFREGTSIGSFVDRRGNELTLTQLRSKLLGE